MKQVSNKYKEQIKELGREIDSIITYYNHYKFITEDNQYILTEDGQKILTEQITSDSVVEIRAEDIYNEKLITHGDILSTMMKEFDFEVRQDMQVGSIVNLKFGLKVNNEYEYIDYGDFIVNQKEYKEDTKTYSYKAYDFMLLTMTPFKAPDLSLVPGEYTIYDLFDYICSYCHLNNGVEMFANSERQYYDTNSLEELGYTNRDILDFISQISGSSIVVNNKNIEVLTPTEVSNNLPKEYTQVEYIDVSASAYIDIGFPMQSDFRVEGKVSGIKHQTNDRYIIGEFPGYLAHAIYGANSHFKVGRYGNNWVDTNYSLIDNEVFTFDTKITPTIEVNINNENVYNNPNISNNFTSEYNGALFTYRYKGNVLSIYAFVGKCYYVNIYDANGTPLRKFVPCIKNSNNEVGMYDLVSDTFYGNNGTGVFTAGAKVVVPFNEEYFKDTNVNFNKVYGPINSILFSRSEDTDVIEIKDEESIKENGVTQIKIKDNPFLEGNDRSDYQEELFEMLNGLTYSLNDLDSIGITYLDYYDKYKVQIGENTYDCLMLNDEIIINQGLEEKIFTEEYEGTTQEYRTSRLSDIDQKWANIQVKKDIGEINLEVGKKVNGDEIISAINLSPEQATINSSKISLRGKEINLTSDTINIASNNFSVDNAGNMTCNGATANNLNVNGGSINLTTSGSTAKLILQDAETPTCKLQQSARRIRWVGLNNGQIDIWNATSSPSIALADGSNTSKVISLSPYGVTFDQGTRRAVETSSDALVSIIKFIYESSSYVEITTSYGTYGISVWASDKRLKKNIKNTSINALNVINKIKHKEFQYKNNDKLIPIGYIADELKEIDENLIVEVGEEKLKQPNETYIIPLLSKAIQEQQEQINELKIEIEKLKERIDNK